MAPPLLATPPECVLCFPLSVTVWQTGVRRWRCATGASLAFRSGSEHGNKAAHLVRPFLKMVPCTHRRSTRYEEIGVYDGMWMSHVASNEVFQLLDFIPLGFLYKDFFTWTLSFGTQGLGVAIFHLK
ncbi:hypothetical protein XENTR_v10019315 [Xenopus tropicalis]|nr:hypothetical protein XENTR_v10019315 [Xenopus tropicalis]